jgi:hypothetical protein
VPTATTTAQPKYTVRKFSQMETRNGVAYTCELLKDGNGGSTAFWYTTPAEKDAFLARAAEETGETFEPDGAYIERLITILENNRKRSVIFMLEGDREEYGEFRQARSGLTFEQVKAALQGAQYADKNPRIWDKTASAFVPVLPAI